MPEQEGPRRRAWSGGVPPRLFVRGSPPRQAAAPTEDPPFPLPVPGSRSRAGASPGFARRKRKERLFSRSKTTAPGYALAVALAAAGRPFNVFTG